MFSAVPESAPYYSDLAPIYYYVIIVFIPIQLAKELIMGIIGESERAARANHLDSKARRAESCRRNAIVSIQGQLPEIVDQVVKNAREWHKCTGSVSVGIARLPHSFWPLVGDVEAQDLVKAAMLKVEPASEVKISADDHSHEIKVAVYFDPPLT